MEAKVFRMKAMANIIVLPAKLSMSLKHASIADTKSLQKYTKQVVFLPHCSGGNVSDSMALYLSEFIFKVKSKKMEVEYG